MFGFFKFFRRAGRVPMRPAGSLLLDWESLESRTLLSAGPSVPAAGGTHVSRSALVQRFDSGQGSNSTIQFSAAPAAAQTGLDALARGTAIAATQKVVVHTSSSGATSYSTILSINGRNTRIAVDSSGNPLVGSIPFSAAPLAVQSELKALDAGAAIPATQLVQVRGRIGGATTYSTSVVLNGRTITIVADSAGNAIQGVMEFSAVPKTVQTALQALDTSATIPATQSVNVRTRFGGTVVYSTSVTFNGVASTIAVTSTGATVTSGRHDGDPNRGDATTLAFSAAPAAVKAGLQSQDTVGTIPDAQLVQVSTERGSTIYSTSVTLGGQATTIAVDSSGNKVTIGGHPFGGGKFLGGGGNYGWGGGGLDSGGASSWFG